MGRSTHREHHGDGRASADRWPAGWILAIFLVGLVISVVMVARSQVTIDQYNLLARGWRLAFQGEWVPHGVRATGRLESEPPHLRHEDDRIGDPS